MEKLHTRLACLGLMFGSGAACAAVQAGDGAMRAQHDVLANLAHDPACVEPLAAAGAATPVDASTHTTVSESVTHGAPHHVAPDAIALDAPAPAAAPVPALSTAPAPSDHVSYAAQSAQPAHADVLRHFAADVVAVQMDASDPEPVATRSEDGTPTTVMAAADSTTPASPLPDGRTHTASHARLAGSRLSAPPAPDFVASLGRVTVGAPDGDDSVTSAASGSDAAGAHNASGTQASERDTTHAALPIRDDANPLPGVVVEPAGAVLAKVIPIDPGHTPNTPDLPRTSDPLPLAPASATSSRTGWTLSTPAPLANDSNTPDRTRDAPSPAPAPAPTASTASNDRDSTANWSEIKVSDAQLDTMRGGFDVGQGLQIAFGIERAVFVNGQLVTTTSFNIPNLAQITPAQAQMLAQTLNTTTVVQNGPNNISPTVISGATAATIVQNTLNNQSIKALTTVNAAVNTLAQFKAMNLQSTINSAIANTVLPR